jgi:hypothetical protein
MRAFIGENVEVHFLGMGYKYFIWLYLIQGRIKGWIFVSLIIIRLQ